LRFTPSRFVAVFTLAISSLGAASCGNDAKTTLNRTFNACAPLHVAIEPGTAPARAQAIADGLALWNNLAGTQLTDGPALNPDGAAAPDGGTMTAEVPMRFASAASAFHGLYDDDAAIVFINQDLDGDQQALSITVAHELGHVMGLLHVPPSTRQSLMNPGNLTVKPTQADADALAALWGPCVR
jgi:hypothetical protein